MAGPWEKYQEAEAPQSGPWEKFRALPGPREEVTNAGGLSGAATQGFLLGAGDEYLAGLSAVLGVQPDGNGSADWWQYDEGFLKGMGDRYSTALESIRSEMGQYDEEHPVASTAAKIGGAVAGTVTGARALSATGATKALPRAMTNVAPTARGRAAQMVGGGTVGGAVEGFNSGEGGVWSRAETAGVGAGVGAVFAPVVGFGVGKLGQVAQRMGGKALRAVFTNRRMFNRNTGALTEAGKRRLAQLGYDAQQLSDEMQRAFGIAAEKVDDTASVADQAIAVGRLGQAERFGVPLTNGQATGEVSQIAAEEGMRAGVRGGMASQTIGGFDRLQGNAVEAARGGIGAGLGNPSGKIDAAEGVISGVRREAEAARQAGSAAYQAVEDAGAAISGRSAVGLKDRITMAVRSEGFPIDGGTPNAMAAMNVLESVFDGSRRGSIPFTEIERARQRLVFLQRAAARGSNGADQVSMDATVREFDGWLDDTISEALMSGDDTVLDQVKQARTLWGQYRSTFLGKDGPANFIRKIVEDDLAPDQVASWMFGASDKIGGGSTSVLARRVKDILGPDSPEWGAVRRAAWDYVTTATEGRQPYGPQRIVSNISELLDGKGKTLGRELFTEQELRVMAEFRDMMKVLIPPAKATNPSGSGYEMQRFAQQMMQSMAGLAGGAAGGPFAGMATSGAVNASGNFSGAVAARAATKGIVPGPPSIPASVGAGVGAAASAQDQVGR